MCLGRQRGALYYSDLLEARPPCRLRPVGRGASLPQTRFESEGSGLRVVIFISRNVAIPRQEPVRDRLLYWVSGRVPDPDITASRCCSAIDAPAGADRARSITITKCTCDDHGQCCGSAWLERGSRPALPGGQSRHRVHDFHHLSNRRPSSCATSGPRRTSQEQYSHAWTGRYPYNPDEAHVLVGRGGA